MDQKPGWKTSEFWLTAMAIVGVALSAKLGIDKETVYVLAALSGTYTVGRSFAKKGA